jgi:putative phage-type endonuclease
MPCPYTEFACDASQRAAIEAARQRSPEWLAARTHRLTASRFAAALGHNPYPGSQPEDVVRDMLWGGFTGNAATEWGTAHEAGACAMYEAHMQAAHADFVVRQHGLIIVPEHPFIGLSPDGIGEHWQDGAVVQTLLEIKCPYRWKEDRFYENRVPLYYWDQIQGIMGFLGLPRCHFVVWTPVGMEVNDVAFDAAYFEGVLKPGLLHFYLHLFWPARCAWREGRLTPPDIYPPLQVELPGNAQDAGHPQNQ